MNHKIELLKGKHMFNIRSYVNDSNNMLKHIGDIILNKDEAKLLAESILLFINDN